MRTLYLIDMDGTYTRGVYEEYIVKDFLNQCRQFPDFVMDSTNDGKLTQGSFTRVEYVVDRDLLEEKISNAIRAIKSTGDSVLMDLILQRSRYKDDLELESILQDAYKHNMPLKEIRKKIHFTIEKQQQDD